MFPKHITANYKSLAPARPETTTMQSQHLFWIQNRSPWDLKQTSAPFLIRFFVHVKTLPPVSPRVSGEEGSGASLGGAPGSPRSLRSWSSADERFPVASLARCHGLRGPLSKTTAWLSWGGTTGNNPAFQQLHSFPRGDPAPPKLLRKGPGRRLRALGRSTGSHRSDFSRGFSTAPSRPPAATLGSRRGSRYGRAPQAPVAAASAVAASRPSAALPVPVGAACGHGSRAVGPALLLPRGGRGGRG